MIKLVVEGRGSVNPKKPLKIDREKLIIFVWAHQLISDSMFKFESLGALFFMLCFFDSQRGGGGIPPLVTP